MALRLFASLIFVFAGVVQNFSPAAEVKPAPPWARGLNTSQLVWLNEGPRRSPAVLREPTSKRRTGAVLILHEAGQHPQHTAVVAPLAKALPRYGWATLALELPDLGPPPYSSHALEAALKSSSERIGAGVALLKEKGHAPLAIVGYGWGASAGAYYLVHEASASIGGLAGLSMGGPTDAAGPEESRVARLLAKIMLPVLDLYGSRDATTVRAGASERAAAARSRAGQFAKPDFRQVELAGADHTYTGLNALLTKQVAGWLRRHVEENPPKMP